MHLGVTTAAGPGGGKSDLLHKGDTLPETTAASLRALLPFWNDADAYRWPEVRAVLQFLEEPLKSDMLRFTSNVFAQKWALGHGECGRDPDPEDFTYPTRDRDTDRFEEWDFVVSQIQDDVMKELGLGPNTGSAGTPVAE